MKNNTYLITYQFCDSDNVDKEVLTAPNLTDAFNISELAQRAYEDYAEGVGDSAKDAPNTAKTIKQFIADLSGFVELNIYHLNLKTNTIKHLCGPS